MGKALKLNFHLVNIFLLIFLFEGNPKLLFGQTKPSIAISIADFNILHQNFNSFEFRFEYRAYNDNIFVNPFGGVMFNMQGAVNIFAGFLKDFRVVGNFYFTPSFAPSIYIKGHSKDLSFTLEFRSQIEAAYQFSNGARIGLNFNHISNGGLRLPNVGVESFGISFILPISILFASANNN